MSQWHVIARLLTDERARFVLVGVVNTGVAYVLFVIFEWLLDGRYLASLSASYLIATIVAFGLHRRFTFGVSGRDRIGVDFVRFESVYVVLFVVNAGSLAILVGAAGWPSWIAQALSTVVITVMSYLAHKYFSFRRRADVAVPAAPPSLPPAPKTKDDRRPPPSDHVI